MAALSPVDNLILLDIFASARESADDSISSQMLAQEVKKLNQKEIVVLADYQQLADYLLKNIQPEDVVLTLGAGDIYKVHQII